MRRLSLGAPCPRRAGKRARAASLITGSALGDPVSLCQMLGMPLPVRRRRLIRLAGACNHRPCYIHCCCPWGPANHICTHACRQMLLDVDSYHIPRVIPPGQTAGKYRPSRWRPPSSLPGQSHPICPPPSPAGAEIARVKPGCLRRPSPASPSAASQATRTNAGRGKNAPQSLLPRAEHIPTRCCTCTSFSDSMGVPVRYVIPSHPTCHPRRGTRKTVIQSSTIYKSKQASTPTSPQQTHTNPYVYSYRQT